MNRLSSGALMTFLLIWVTSNWCCWDWFWVTFLRMFPLEDKTPLKRLWWRVFSRTFGHLSHSVWSHFHIWCYRVRSEDKWLLTWFDHSIHLPLWVVLIVRWNEQLVVLGIIQPIEQMLERLHIRAKNIGFYWWQQGIGVFVHDLRQTHLQTWVSFLFNEICREQFLISPL